MQTQKTALEAQVEEAKQKENDDADQEEQKEDGAEGGGEEEKKEVPVAEPADQLNGQLATLTQ